MLVTPDKTLLERRAHTPPGSADCWCEPDVLVIGQALVIVHHQWRDGVRIE
jgi:hypothetical protein